MTPQTCNIRFQTRATGLGLTLTIKLNDEVIKTFEETPVEWTEVFYSFPDENKPYKLVIEMSGKTDDHTVLDDDGNIMLDSLIEIKDMSLDEIELGFVFSEQAKYHHNGNGYTEWQEEEFHGIMGCNGYVEMNFTGPVYLWLLENM